MSKNKTKKKKNKTRLRIAQLHWGFPPIIGGVETHLKILLPEMVRTGNRVHLLTGSFEGIKNRYAYKGVEIFRTPLMDLNWLYKRGLQALDDPVRDAFKDFIKESRPDVIHCHNMHYFSKLHVKTIEDMAKARGVPLILTAHNVWDDILFLELTRDIRWSHIIAVSHFIKKELLGAGCDDRNITTVHHGIDSRKLRPGISTREALRKFPALRNRPVVFHPARVGLAKGCDISIKALRIIKEKFPDVLLVLAGAKNIIDWGSHQQKDIAYLVDLIKHLGLKQNVFIDMFTLDQMAQIYGIAKVCVYPSSVGEPFGLTMLESLSSAKPMVVTDTGGMPEIIRDRINGFVVPVRDFEVLASRVIELLSDERLARRLGDTGRQMVESHYTKEIVSKNTLHIYERELGKK